MSSYDPRKPRKNPEIAEILRCISRTHRELQSAETHKQRRGHSMILKAHLEMLLEEPETFTDLQPGTIEELRLLESPELAEKVKMTGVSPFEEAGDSGDTYFFLADTGYLSELYEPPIVAPYQLMIMHTHGPWVYSMEKLYACPTETTHHFTEVAHLKRFAGSRTFDRKKPFWLMNDPRGVVGGRTLILKNYASLKAAKKAAIRMGERSDIRFLVARSRIEFLNR